MQVFRDFNIYFYGYLYVYQKRVGQPYRVPRQDAHGYHQTEMQNLVQKWQS